MTDTPTKQEIQSKNDNVPGAMPVEQKRNNRNDRKRNRRGDSKNLERDSDWQERVVQIRRVSKTVKGGKKMSFRAIVVVGNEKGQVGVGVGTAGDVIGAVRKGVSDGKKYLVHQEFLFLRERDVLRLFQDLYNQYHHQLDHLFAAQKILLLC